MAEMKKIEEVLSRSSRAYDSKHINNTSNRPMPTELIEKINNGDVTIEVLDDFTKRGYNIYKYRTQLTIHGTFDAELQRRVHGYVCMCVNKNGSLGVRWIAIDAKKKARIFHLLGECGWHVEHNSQEYYAYRLAQIKSKDDPKIAEYKALAERINHDLFLGDCSLYYVRDMWGQVYAKLDLYVNAIYAENVDKLVENVSGRTVAEIEQVIAQKEAEREARWAEMHRKAEEERKKQEEERAPKLAAAQKEVERIKAEMIADGWVKATVEMLKKDMEIRTVFAHCDRYSTDVRVEDVMHTVTMIRSGVAFTRYGSWSKAKIDNRTEFYVKRPKIDSTKTPDLFSEPVEGSFKIMDYSEKSVALVGDTKPIKDKLVKLGGRFNPKLTCGAGWVFPKTKEVELRKVVGL